VVELHVRILGDRLFGFSLARGEGLYRMLYCEPTFMFLFLPILLAVHYIAPGRARNAVITLASLLFYLLGEWRFTGWLLASIAVNYWVAIGIDSNRGTARARNLLALGIVSDLGLLIVFKYAGFLVTCTNKMIAAAHGSALLPVPKLLLPLGISFFTFHKISYKVDVWRGVAEVRRKPLDLMLYILLFPQLISGPIVRYNEIAAELVKRTCTRKDFAEGVQRFIFGLGKKMIVANTVAYTADQLFAVPQAHLTTGMAWLGVFCYAIQIYFDFSGYSDMAVGLARMFGFHFPENFNYPYISTSITEFWRRWHMSLSRWFRDYLYIPMGGSHRGRLRTYFNLCLVFFLCGLWHGASMHFVIWGSYQGALLVTERLWFGKVLEACPRVLRHIYSLAAVMFGWVIFRVESMSSVIGYMRAMVGLAQGNGATLNASLYINTELIIISVVAIIGSMPVRALARKIAEHIRLVATDHRRTMADALIFGSGVAWQLTVLLYSLMLIAARTYNPFIYYRF